MKSQALVMVAIVLLTLGLATHHDEKTASAVFGSVGMIALALSFDKDKEDK